MTRVVSMIVLLTLALLAAPLAAEAQPAGKVYRIGLLRNGPPPETFMAGLRRGLRELGYIEGQNVSDRVRGDRARGSARQTPPLDLLRLNLDVLLVSGTPPIRWPSWPRKPSRSYSWRPSIRCRPGSSQASPGQAGTSRGSSASTLT